MNEPRPTGDDAQRFSQRTQRLGEHGRLTPEEAAELLEDAGSQLTNWGSTAAALTALEARQQRLNSEQAQLLGLLAKDPANPEATQYLQQVQAKLRRTLELLALYREQQRQAN